MTVNIVCYELCHFALMADIGNSAIAIDKPDARLAAGVATDAFLAGLASAFSHLAHPACAEFAKDTHGRCRKLCKGNKI